MFVLCAFSVDVDCSRVCVRAFVWSLVRLWFNVSACSFDVAFGVSVFVCLLACLLVCLVVLSVCLVVCLNMVAVHVA